MISPSTIFITVLIGFYHDTGRLLLDTSDISVQLPFRCVDVQIGARVVPDVLGVKRGPLRRLTDGAGESRRVYLRFKDIDFGSPTSYV